MIQSSNSPLVIYPKKTKTLIQKTAWTSMFTAELFTTAKTCKQRMCPSKDEWIKMWYTHTHTLIHIHTHTHAHTHTLTHTHWSIPQIYKRITFCHLQQHG